MPALRHAGRRLVETCLHRLLDRIDHQLCPPGRLPTHDIHRILVLRPNHRLGNAVLISPLLNAIEVRYPGAEIDILSAGCAAQELFATRFQIHRVLCLKRRIVRHLPATVARVRELRAIRYDMVINPCVASHSAHLLLGICKARYKVGFPNGRVSKAPRAGYPDMPEHLAKRGVYLLRLARGDAPRTPWPRLDVRLSDDELRQAGQALERIIHSRGDRRPPGPVIGIFAHATGNKRLPEAWWRHLVTVLGASCQDLRIINVLAAHGHSQLPEVAYPFYTQDLRKLAAMLANLDGFISGDCGVMHLAVAAGTPTLGLFVRANQAKYAPYGGHNSWLNLDQGDLDNGTSRTSAAITSAVAWVQQIAPIGHGTLDESRS